MGSTPLRFDIVATLGPASFACSPHALAEAGATAFRLNASHMDPRAIAAAIDRVRADVPEMPLVVDLQGAKMRLGEFPACPVARGARLVLAAERLSRPCVPLPHPELFRQVVPGDTLSADDDRLRFRVEEVGEGFAHVEALGDGVLRPRKGINVVEHPIALSDLTARDAHLVAALRDTPFVAWAVSFMTDGREAGWITRRCPGATVIGKVERREAVQQMARLAATVDALWICRGDLGAQLGVATMARWIAAFDPRSTGVPVLMAGQVLEHLTAHAAPTRSEACHLFDLVSRGYAGIVLSDETAIGHDPLEATRTAAALVRSFRQM
jgi:pyruvate kinase